MGRKLTLDDSAIRDFWQEHPCGETLVDASPGDLEAMRSFFDEYDHYRYRTESHILAELDGLRLTGLDVLEIGLGQGADSEQIARRGARYSGVDLTAEAVRRTSARFNMKGLPYQQIVQGSVLELPFDDDSFDVVYSHGVLHHVPDIRQGSAEIARVLRPGGRLEVMVYAKHSLNYLVAISAVRRLGLAAVYLTGRPRNELERAHVENARSVGLWNYLQMKNFVHRNTDGPHNPFSRVYTPSALAEDFPDFTLVSTRKHFLHAPPLKIPGEHSGSRLGWHLWATLRVKGQ